MDKGSQEAQKAAEKQKAAAAAAAQSGLDSFLAEVEKKKKVNVLDKSKADWQVGRGRRMGLRGAAGGAAGLGARRACAAVARIGTGAAAGSAVAADPWDPPRTARHPEHHRRRRHHHTHNHRHHHHHHPQTFKAGDAAVGDELESYKRSSGQYLDKQDFLKRAELREYELERDKRLAGDVRNRGRL